MHDHRRQQDDEQDADQADGSSIGRSGQAEGHGHDPHRHEGADHEDVAVGEVDQLDDPVDHRVAEGDQRVDRAERQDVVELLDAKDEERDDAAGPRTIARDAAGARSGN